jgi:hypothetical protein
MVGIVRGKDKVCLRKGRLDSQTDRDELHGYGVFLARWLACLSRIRDVGGLVDDGMVGDDRA